MFEGSGGEYAKPVSCNVAPCNLIEAQTFRRHLLPHLVNEILNCNEQFSNKKKSINVSEEPATSTAAGIFLLKRW